MRKIRVPPNFDDIVGNKSTFTACFRVFTIYQDVMDEEETLEIKQSRIEPETKRVRRRRKKIYQEILKQMEFYFSDASLTKDRFLQSIIQNDPYVDLSVFLKFNKIRALTHSVDDIANALMKSELLTLSEDRSKVCREKPIRRNCNEDECSIYVENLPADAKHEWLQEIFSVYGKVAYVSIPKYKQSGKIKGFAFVEFESAESANRALQEYGAAGCCLSSDMPPDHLCSLATFEPNENKNQVGLPPQSVEKHQEENIEEVNKSIEIEVKEDVENEEESIPSKEKTKKRKKEESDEEEEQMPKQEIGENEEKQPESCEPEECASPKKKKKKSEEGNGSGKEEEKPQKEDGDKNPGDCLSPQSKEKKLKKRKREHEEEDNNEEQLPEEEEEENAEEDVSPQSKEKKRKKRKKDQDDDEQDDEQQIEEEVKKPKLEEESTNEKETGEEQKERKKKTRKKRNKNKKEKVAEETIGLRILSKKEWKRLRNKYLNLQRKNMKALRMQMMGGRWGNYWRDDRGDNEEECKKEDEKDIGHSDTHGAEDNNVDEEKTKSGPRVQFTPGVILKIQLKEPLDSAKKFKAEIKSLPMSNAVAYVDARDAASVVYIRCETAEGAKDLLNDLSWEDKGILEGDEENDYWEKILKDRDEKITKKIRVKQRGRDKILRKAESLMGKHVRFEH